ncbi:M20/M25/M40 family metallo-hydrolase [Amycolatopsis sacchari]|uniref:M20/M25/M40 family metallo-hydrolase n=1 Tax=Amycolatopsis sacchari TaxID=115433 RepID=UPI003D702DB0
MAVRSGQAGVAIAPPDPATRRRWPLWVALGVLAVAVLGAVLPLRTPAPRPVSAPADSFSAGRAMAHLPAIAAVAHPTGSAAQGEVRERLVATLRGLGFEPRVTTRVAQAPAEPSTVGLVTNIQATIPGRAPTGSVLVVAHYDSVPTGPGASDDGANVAAVLELARALHAGPAPRNTIDFVLTDGEEAGSLGAKALVDAGYFPDPGRVAVLNLEARGVSGPAILFETAGTGLAPAIRASGAVTTSATGEVYRVLPNSTDLTVFREAGLRGLNFAFVDGASRYHTSHDDIASVDPGSVQDMGDEVLAAARQLAAADLGATGTPVTYFGLFGAAVSYPDGWVLPLALVALAGFAFLLWRGRLSARLVGRSALTFVPVPLVAAVTGLAGWWASVFLRPGSALGHGFTGSLGWYAAAELVLVVLAVLVWYRRARRRAGLAEVLTAVVGWFAVLAVVLALLAPSAAYLVTWPALAGVLVVAVASRRAVSPVAAVCAAVPAVLLLVPACVLLVPVVGLGMLAVMLVPAALVVALPAGLADFLPRGRATTAGLSAVALAAAAVFVATAALDGPSRGAPKPVSLGYVLDAATGSAFWVSDGGDGQPVVGSRLTEGPRRFDAQVPFLGAQPVRSGPAPAAAVPGPRADVVGSREQNDVRTVHLRLSAPPGTYQLALNADTTAHEVVGAIVDGISLPLTENWPDADGGWHWGFVFTGPPPDGVDVVLQVRGDGPLPVRVVSSAAGFPDGIGAPVLPPELHYARWPSVAGQSFVARTVRL